MCFKLNSIYLTQVLFAEMSMWNIKAKTFYLGALKILVYIKWPEIARACDNKHR